MTQQSAARPFRVLGIQQIAIGGPSKERLKKLWVEMFGLAVTGNYVSERENVDEDITQMGSGPFRVEVDLMQPLDPARKPAVHEPPLNHVGLWIDDLPKAVEWLTAQGVRFAPGGIRKGAAGFDITFLHPKANDQFPIAGRRRADRTGAGPHRRHRCLRAHRLTVPDARAAVIEAVLAGLRAASGDDDKLLTAAARVFDGLYQHYQQEPSHG
jgi:lactoylglutathione lyase